MLELRGRLVRVDDNNVDRALRRFKKKIQNSNVLNELRQRESYEKPTTQRKKRRAAAVMRWKKYLQQQQLPVKQY